MTEKDCVFCQVASLTLVGENTLAFAIYDRAPVRRLHTLISPKRHVADIFETDADEREAIHSLALLCRKIILAEDPDVAGFNFGSNVGIAAGQKVLYAHVHLIPRRFGDADLPGARPD